MGVLKKGFEDAFFAIAVILTIAIFILVLSKVWAEIKTPLDTSISKSLPADTNMSVNVTKTFEIVSNTTILLNKLVPLIIIGLFAFIFIGMAIYFNHPMMIVVGIIVLAVAVLLGSIYANIYNEISSSGTFATQKAELGVQDKYMQYLPYIIVGIFVATTIAVLYLRKGGGSGQL